jgi:nitroreductase
MDSKELLTTTRAVRLKLDVTRTVEPELIQDCIRQAIQAPTPANVQSWRWMVVRDTARRAALGRLFREVGAPYLDTLAASGVPETRLRGGRHLIDIVERVPVLVIPCLLGRPPESNDVFASAVFWGGIYPAAWSFQLALRSKGLGSTFTTWHLRREAEAAEILGIPNDVTQTCMFPVAYATVTKFKPAKRIPAEEVSFTDKWGLPDASSREFEVDASRAVFSPARTIP